MQEFAKFIDLSYKPGESPYLVQGIKNGKTPKNAIAGGNGSFVVKGNSSKLILTVKTESGKYISINIINIVRKVLNRSRITEKLCDRLELTFSSESFKVSEKHITNLEEIISKI